jgi:hypothetical protein
MQNHPKLRFNNDVQSFLVCLRRRYSTSNTNCSSSTKILATPRSASTSSHFHHRCMLEPHCASRVPALEESEEQRIDLRACHQRSALERHFSLFILPYYHCCDLQHLLGMDRSGYQANGAVLSIKQRERSPGERFPPFAVSFFLHSIGSDKGLQRPVSARCDTMENTSEGQRDCSWDSMMHCAVERS